MQADIQEEARNTCCRGTKVQGKIGDKRFYTG